MAPDVDATAGTPKGWHDLEAILAEGPVAALLATYLVVAGPDPERNTVVRWRCVDLRTEIARRFGIEVHQSTVSEWLHQLGLTRLQPRPYHPKKDAAAQEAYKKRMARPVCQRFHDPV